MAIAATSRPGGGRLPGHHAEERITLWRRLLDVLRGDKLASFAVASALVIGFFHGWLKLKIRHPIATFLFDIPLIFALFLTFLRLKSAADFLPPGNAGRAMKGFYGVVIVWFLLALVLPWGAPFLAALAALRGWVFATLMFGLGYHLIGSRRQLHAFFILTILLAALTSLYATRQTQEEVDAMRAVDAYFEEMTRSQGYVDSEGRYVLRRFSTFISSGAFGGTMSVCLCFLAALFTDRFVQKGEKLLLGLMALVIGYGMFLSGARSAVLALGIGLALIIWYRRLPIQLVILGLLCGVGLVLASMATGGGILDRISTLQPEEVFMRFYIVAAPGWDYLVRSGFLGGGLGKSAVGLPMSLRQYFPSYEIWGVDGDLGKAMAELGVVGVGVLAWLFAAGLKDGFEVLRRRRMDSVGTMALASFCTFTIAVIQFPIGSPFIGIPLGVLTWFFLGAALKLDRIDRPGALVGLADGEVVRQPRSSTPRSSTSPPRPAAASEGGPASGDAPPAAPRRSGGKRFLLYHPPALPAESSAPRLEEPPAPSPSPSPSGKAKRKAGKRFLYG